MLPLLVAILESIRKTSLSCKFLENQNVSVQKLKPFSKTDFSDGESCLSDMLNMIELERCSQIIFPDVLSGEVLTIYVGL